MSGRWHLTPFAILFSSLLLLRKFLFQIHFFKSYQANRPVISIGNVTLGGTGKSPITDYCLQWCEQNHIRAGVVLRSFKASSKKIQKVSPDSNPREVGDEALWLAQKNPKAVIYSSPTKWKSVQEMTEKENVDVVFVDDGFQHRKLNRNLDIVLLDATQPLWHYHLFPVGMARESLKALKRSQVVIFTKVNLLPTGVWPEKRRFFVPYFPVCSSAHLQSASFAVMESRYEIQSFYEIRDQMHISKKDFLIQKFSQSFIMVCGVGNPTSFRLALEEEALWPKDQIIFSDHHDFQIKDYEQIANHCKIAGVTKILITEKDAIKWDVSQLPEIEIWVVCMKVEVDGLSGVLHSVIKNRLS